MPFSAEENKEFFAEIIRKYQPGYMLDIGPGAGVYSDLARGVDPDIALDAVEAWGPYVEKFNLREKYNEIIISDVRFIDTVHVSGYAMVVIGDVIEHLPKFAAAGVLARLIRNNKYVFVSFPVLHLDQEPWEGNFFETHRDHWSYEEFVYFCGVKGFKILETFKGDILASFLVMRLY